jgi:hypothetical protein
MKATESQFIRTIEIKDRSGRVVGTKEVVTYQGLLSKAHDEGLKAIQTSLLQIPGEENARTAIAKAIVETEKGSFEGIGDASPESVTAFLQPHLIRMAETRAKARALRDAVNVGVVSFEELDGEDLPARESSGLGSGAARSNGRGNGAAAHPRGRVPAHTAEPGQFVPMSENQRRFLFRLLADDGLQGEAAHEHLLDKFDVASLTEVSKEQASAMIDSLQSRPRERQESGRGAPVQR